ncbi:MAG: PQQ-binding-like beta-propeller repeat protein [Zavarzinella sp.]
MNSRLFVRILSFHLLLATSGWAQDRILDNPVLAQLESARQLAAAAKWTESLSAFQKILDTAPNELVPADQRHHLQARWEVHRYISLFPTETLAVYRNRLDGQVQNLLKTALTEKNDASLQDIVGRFFCATPTEQAIKELARRATQRGDLLAAEQYWHWLLPRTAGESSLRFPNPQTPAAQALAEIIFIQIIRGELPQAQLHLDKLKQTAPEATGKLWRQEGKLVELLRVHLKNASKLALPVDRTRVDRTTFGGFVDRNATQVESLPYYFAESPAWEVPLPLPFKNPEIFPDNTPHHPRAVGFHPLVFEDELFFASNARLVGIPLQKPETTIHYHDQAIIENSFPSDHPQPTTLSRVDDRLLANMGGKLAVPLNLDADQSISYIACFGKVNDGPKRKLLWKLSPPKSDSVRIWTGCPVYHNTRLYATFWTEEGTGGSHHVACYTWNEDESPPILLWEKKLQQIRDRLDEPISQLQLTISGNTLIVTPGAGIVFGLEALSGNFLWQHHYPQRDDNIVMVRDTCPALVAEEQVFLAPPDAERLICLNLHTGALRWELTEVHVYQMLGVAHNRLITTFRGGLPGIRGISIFSGADSGDTGWTIHDPNGSHTFGRGLLSHDTVLWPTKNALHFLDPATGKTQRASIRKSFGNLYLHRNRLLSIDAVSLASYQWEAFDAPEKNLQSTVPGSPQWKDIFNAATARDLEQCLQVTPDLPLTLQWDLVQRYLQLRGRLPELPATIDPRIKLLAGTNSDIPTDSPLFSIRDEQGIPRRYSDWAAPKKLTTKPDLKKIHFVSGAVVPPTRTPLDVLKQEQTVVKNGMFNTKTYPLGIPLSGNGPLAVQRGQQVDFLDQNRLIELDFAAESTHGDVEQCLIVGPQGVAACNLQTGKLLWQILANSLPVFHAGNYFAPERETNSAFLLVAQNQQQLCFFCHNQRSVVIYDRTTGNLLGHLRIENDVYEHFQSATLLENRQLLTVDTTGKVVCWDLTHTVPKEIWYKKFPRGQAVCHAIDGDIAILSFSNLIASLQTKAGKLNWQLSFDNEFDHAGAPAGIIDSNWGILVLEKRNYGVVANLISRQTGKKLWQEEVYLGIQVHDIQLQQQFATFITDTHVGQLDLIPGKRTWRQLLPQAEKYTQIHWANQSLILTPKALTPNQGTGYWADHLAQWLIHRQWFRILEFPLLGWDDHPLPVQVVQPATGKMEAISKLLAGGPELVIKFPSGRKEMVLMTNRAIHRFPAPLPIPTNKETP